MSVSPIQWMCLQLSLSLTLTVVRNSLSAEFRKHTKLQNEVKEKKLMRDDAKQCEKNPQSLPRHRLDLPTRSDVGGSATRCENRVNGPCFASRSEIAKI